LRQIPGVPLIYLHGNAPTLERPSAMTESLTERIADGKTELSQHQRQIIAALKEQTFGPAEPAEKKKKKRRGPKGPNPLSCKKKKVKKGLPAPTTEQQLNEESKRRKRRHKKKKISTGDIMVSNPSTFSVS
jgi:U3 small nucleolar RNA-associated protein 23